MRKLKKVSALVVVGIFVCIMLTPSVMAPNLPAPVPLWSTEGNVVEPDYVLGTMNNEDLRIITNGEERMIITSEGNVGIGTTSPSGELEVVGNIVVSGTVDGVDIDFEVDALQNADIALQNQIDDLQDEVDSKTVNQLIQDFVVAEEESVTAGDVVGFVDGYVQKWELGGSIDYGSEYVFNSELTGGMSAATLTSTKFVVAYSDVGNSDYGTAVIGDVSGNTITFGSEWVFNTDDTISISVAALSSNKLVVAYYEWPYCKAVIGDVSGDTIKFGSEYEFHFGYTSHTSVAGLSSNQFIVAYTDFGNFQDGTVILGDVSGNTITFSSEYVFNTGPTSSISTAALSSAKFVITYRDYNIPGYGTAIIGDVFINTIDLGLEYVFNSDITAGNSVAVLCPCKFVVAYIDGGNSWYATAVLGYVCGNIITYSSEYVFNLAPIDSISVGALSSSKFMVAYKDGGNSMYGTAIIGYVFDSTITFSSENVFKSAWTEIISGVTLSSDKFVVNYRDEENYYGKAIVSEVQTGIPEGSPIVGIAKESKTAGQTVPVIINGVSDLHYGLSLGAIYYINADGSLTTYVTYYKIGLAISSTEILLADPFF